MFRMRKVLTQEAIRRALRYALSVSVVRARPFVVLAFAATTSCSLFTSLGDLSSGAPPDGAGVDGGVPPLVDGGEAGALRDAEADAADAGERPNLHPQGTFDTVGCGTWGNYLATLTAATPGRMSAGACRVCATSQGAKEFFTIDDNGLPGAPIAGARYRATAWVRPAPGAVTPTYAMLHIRTFGFDPDFTTYEQADPVAAVPFTTDWMPLSVELTIQQARGKLNVFLGAPGAVGACFLVDDVRLERVD